MIENPKSAAQVIGLLVNRKQWGMAKGIPYFWKVLAFVC